MPVLEMSDSDPDLRSTRSERSRTPQREVEQNWIMMVEAEPGLVPVRQANQIQSAWVGEPKPFGKPERFGGDERRWTQWRFGMKAYLSLCGVAQETLLDRVARRAEQVKLTEISEDFVEKNKLMYYILASSCTGRAQCYVRTAERRARTVWRPGAC